MKLLELHHTSIAPSESTESKTDPYLELIVGVRAAGDWAPASTPVVLLVGSFQLCLVIPSGSQPATSHECRLTVVERHQAGLPTSDEGCPLLRSVLASEMPGVC